MKSRLLKRISFAALFVLVAALSSYITFIKVRGDHYIRYSNSSLYELSNEMDVLLHLAETGTSDLVLMEKIETVVVGKLINIAVIDPRMRELGNTPLSALCKAVFYNKRFGIGKSGFGKYRDEKLTKVAAMYLDSIETQLLKHIQGLTETDFPREKCPILL